MYTALAAIFSRERLPIQSKIWKTAPWSVLPKVAKDTMTDIILETGSLIFDLDQFRAGHLPPNRHGELIKAGIRVRSNLLSWYLDNREMVDRFDYIKHDKIPNELTDDRDIAAVYMTNIYWIVCIMVETTMRFLELIKSVTAVGHDNSSNGSLAINLDLTEGLAPLEHEAKHTRKPSPPKEQEVKKDQCKDAWLDSREWQAIEASILECCSLYAYKITHSFHLLTQPNVGIAVRALSIIPISLALSLLAAFEPLDQPSNEKKILRQLYSVHFLSPWANNLSHVHRLTQLGAGRSVPSADNIERFSKIKRLRWWMNSNPAVV